MFMEQKILDSYIHQYTLPNNFLGGADVYKQKKDEQLVIIKRIMIPNNASDKEMQAIDTEIQFYRLS